MTFAEMQVYIESVENKALLREEKNFDERVDVIDFLEFHVLEKVGDEEQLMLLQQRAEKVRDELEEVNATLFKKLQHKIRTGKIVGEPFKKLIGEYLNLDVKDNRKVTAGYDNLDVFVNGLLPIQMIPEQTKELESEMVFYQKTPARIVFELVERAHFTAEDVFFDLGSGLGQVGMLVNLLAGIKTVGVEFEPAFCNSARNGAAQLNLSDVTFVNEDARQADYSKGTVFFMFTPFKGKMLQDVLECLRKESLSRKIKIFTYGPCSDQVASKNWLRSPSSKADNIHELKIFTTL